MRQLFLPLLMAGVFMATSLPTHAVPIVPTRDDEVIDVLPAKIGRASCRERVCT